ncbi:hypothetical protein ACQP1P_26365 [Dactylosporangium sp. CA-052675]
MFATVKAGTCLAQAADLRFACTVRLAGHSPFTGTLRHAAA